MEPGPELLAALNEHERECLLERAERVELELGQVLWRPGEPGSHVYFPINSLISQLGLLAGGRAVETGVVGPEGMIGIWLHLGFETTPHLILDQIPGEAWRLRVRDFRACLGAGRPATSTVGKGSGEALSRLLGRYAASVLYVSAQIMACNRAHNTAQRGARWLLMAHDRVRRDEFRLTHEFFAQMLGVRRATVTEILGTFQDAGLIEYRRGVLALRSRSGLLAAACECYSAIRVQEWRTVARGRAA